MDKRIYVCGPTVYDNPHIGNLKPIITFDIFVRALRALDNEVEFIHNITDIDDKIIEKAKKENKSEKAIAEKYTKVYLNLLEQTQVLTPTSMPKVTENMSKIISFIEKLIEKEYAYESNGNVFFDISKDEIYGSISNRKIEEMKSEKASKDKRNKEDFALWKNTTEGVTFDSPWGKGRPGWHTECATFISEVGQLSLHGGGVDLLFPHNENEATQFRALHDEPITLNWKHLGQINFNESKMSKSEGNVIDAQDFIKEHGPDVLRMIFLSSSLTSPINITEEVIQEAKTKIQKIYIKSKLAQLNGEIMSSNNTIAEDIAKWDFAEAMRKLNENIKQVSIFSGRNTNEELLGNIKLLGFLRDKHVLTAKEKENFFIWNKLREEKAFDEADKLRAQLDFI